MKLFFPLIWITLHILAIGDSLTVGWPFEPGYVQYMPMPYEIQTCAQGGWTFEDALDIMPECLESHPDLVLLWLGTNDDLQGVWSTDQYNRALEVIRMYAPGARVLVGALPEVPALPLASEHNQELLEAGYNLVPFALEDGDIWQDGLHLTDQGYRAVADDWRAAIIQPSDR